MASLHLDGHCGGRGVVLGGGIHSPQRLLYAVQVGSQFPVLTAFWHLDGHCGGGVDVVCTQGPQMLP